MDPLDSDLTLLQHEPLRSHIAMYLACESRSQSKRVVSSFVKAMQANDQAASESKAWAHRLFAGVYSGGNFEATDNGEKLFTAFLIFHVKLSGNNVKEFHNNIFRNGIDAINLRLFDPDTQCSTRTRGGKARSNGRGEKKRKPSSQKPPVTTPSDTSSDEKGPSTTHKTAAASSTSHRPKRIASSASCLTDKLPVETKRNPAHGFKTRHRGTVIDARSLTTICIKSEDHPVSCPRKGRRNNERLSHISNGSMLASTKYRRLRRINSADDLPAARPEKRLRCSSMSILGGERERVRESTLSLPFPTLRAPTGVACSSLTREKVRKKRARPESKTSSVVSHENAPVNFCELLGPDIRPFRPLPRKMRKERIVPATNQGTIRDGLSLGHTDQLLRDIASNTLTVERERGGLDLPDWTQDKEQDAECDDSDDEDEADEVHFTSTVSLSSGTTAKPSVPAPPRIWAQSRQEVCESFEYFRSYHSGVYSKDDIVKGYLLGAYAASRDIFHHGGKLIISHGGGKSESILENRRGSRRFQSDQDQEATDKSVRALLKTWQDRRPLVLLADDKYALFPFNLTSGNYTYVVLGLYWISHAWAECQSARDGSGRIIRWKFAFQWCEGQDDPWWSPRQVDAAPEPPVPIPDPKTSPTNGASHIMGIAENSTIRCESCREQSPFVYKQGWMCLNPHCDMFWTINNEEPKEFDYREEFLRLLPLKFERLPSITPARVVETPSGVTTTFAFSKGWHCVECGRLSCRYKWEHWECANCQSKYVVKGRIRSPKEFWHQRPLKEFLHSRIGKDSGILPCHLELVNLGEQNGFTNRLTFILPCERGRIHVILGTPLSNGDADHVFQLYQQQASTGELKLRRYPLRNHRARGLLLTNYFSQNSGEPYQYVGGTGNTVPFHEAPDCVRQALAVIKERSRLALGIDIPFNEVLSAAYMERQKMSFHSDSEKGLGPIVASLSLGSAALMHFRLHVSVGDPKGKSACALTLVLRHGDVLVMEGEGVQKYYEHTVVPMNFRIAATARCIGST